VDKVASTKKALMVRIELFVIFRYWREPAARQCLPSRTLFEDERTRWSKAERAKMTPTQSRKRGHERNAFAPGGARLPARAPAFAVGRTGGPEHVLVRRAAEVFFQSCIPSRTVRLETRPLEKLQSRLRR
jgi:hypothetical protein